MPGLICNLGCQLQFTGIPDQVTPPPSVIWAPGPDTKIMIDNQPIYDGVQTLTVAPGWTTVPPSAQFPVATGPGVSVAPAVFTLNPTAVKVLGQFGGVITIDCIAQAVVNFLYPAPTPPAGPGPQTLPVTVMLSITAAGQTKVMANG